MAIAWASREGSCVPRAALGRSGQSGQVDLGLNQWELAH